MKKERCVQTENRSLTSCFRKKLRQRQVMHHKSPAQPYATLGVNANRQAIGQLSLSGYKLYMYFALNADGFCVVLNTANLCKWAGMSESTYRKAFEELVMHGYMCKAPGWKNAYHFYEDPNQGKRCKKLCGQA